MNTIRLPHRQICSVCHHEYAIDYWVPDEIWEAATHRSQRQDLICVSCFGEMADTRWVYWAETIKFVEVVDRITQAETVLSLTEPTENQSRQIVPSWDGERCNQCGCNSYVGFLVPDEVWEAVMGDSQCTVCVNCWAAAVGATPWVDVVEFYPCQADWILP